MCRAVSGFKQNQGSSAKSRSGSLKGVSLTGVGMAASSKARVKSETEVCDDKVRVTY
jgi:hypothetical protein